MKELISRVGHFVSRNSQSVTIGVSLVNWRTQLDVDVCQILTCSNRWLAYQNGKSFLEDFLF